MGTATVEIRKLEGRDHFVMPVVMLGVGVFAGSNGPLLYQANELQQTAHLWSGKPIVIFHPKMYTNGYVGHPEVFSSQRVGTVFNARFDGQRLLADAWIDIARVGQVDMRVLHAIQQRQVLEVSTGLFTENDQRSGVFNGRTYHGVASNLHPDHLAILPDQKGAYSIADGGGLLRNNAYVEPPMFLTPAMA